VKPLTQPDCDLRDFSFMPLDVVRLRDSDLAALESAEAFRAAVLLWCASWHQLPAASLPDDDRVLANLAGFGRVVKEWQKVRQGALRGWVVCDDGRLYHSVIAEKANEAWQRKLEQAWRTECARIKKHNQRHPDKQLPFPTFDEWLSRRTNQGCPEGHDVTVPVVSPDNSNPIDTDRDSDRDSTKQETHSDIQPSPVVGVEDGKPIGTPAGHLAAELIKAGVKVTAQHPTLLAWLSDGYTREDVIAALEVARITKPAPTALPAGYLDAVVRSPKPPSRPKQPGQSSAVTPWFMSVAGIEAKAKELNIKQQRDEQFPYFKERVYKAAKVTPDMLRAAQIDHGVRA
jgi:hypothetical protein